MGLIGSERRADRDGDCTVGWKKGEENNGAESGNPDLLGFIMINARARARDGNEEVEEAQRRAGDASICPSVREGDRE